MFAPDRTPAYSNAAFRILAYVMEKLLGQTYENITESSVLGPLQLTHTTLTVPAEGADAVVPNGDSGWFQNFGDEVA